MNRYNLGFTVIELLISASIVSLLATVAIPSLQAGMYAAHSTEVRTELLSSLMSASNKAALHGVRTTICPSIDLEHCATGYNWSMGWIAFIDQNGSRERETGEALIRTQSALTDAHLYSSSGRTRITFQGNGGNAGSNATFTLCDKRGAAKAQTLVISNAGNIRYGVANEDQINLACQF